MEQVCQELGLKYTTEDNAGRMYINLQGGPAVMTPHGSGNGHAQQQHGAQTQQGGQQGGQQQQYLEQQYGNQQQYGGQQQQGNNQNQQMEDFIEKKVLPRILKKIEGCCVVM